MMGLKSGRAYLFLLALLGAIFLWRWVQIRHLALPAWVDSVHHVLLVRILLEQGRLPDTWGPYLPQVPFFYHFGFHLSAAALAKLGGLNVGRGVLWAGQLWQAALAASVYGLGLTIWRNPPVEPTGERIPLAHQKALAATLLVGFVSQMPAYYAAWGRYTLLAGVTLLAFAMTAALSRRWALLTGLIVAVAVTHLYALLLLGLFLAGLFLLAPPMRGRLLLTGSLGLLLAAPWLWRVISNSYAAPAQIGVEETGYSLDYMLYLLGPARNLVLLALALAGGLSILVAAIRARRSGGEEPSVGMLALSIYALLLILLLGPWQFGPFRPDYHAAAVLFLPAVLLAAEGLWLAQNPALRWGALLALVGWGLFTSADIIRPDTVFVTPADVAAIEWAAVNTPAEASFLIDVTPWLAQWRGKDGGWWLAPLTGRRTVLPAAAYGWGPPEFIDQVRQTAARVYGLAWYRRAEYCHQLADLMRANQADYYYTQSPQPAACPQLDPVYQDAGPVRIYRLKLPDLPRN